jgi:two-component system CheB/CheR fusion protein
MRWLALQVVPIPEAGGAALGATIVFTDITAYKRLQEELETSNHELETAFEELQSTNEELETTNEELQSTVEELETTNEELQSTNEELETMNEELQSTNEELQAINDEVRRRSEELNEANAFLQAVFASMRGGVAILDPNMRVLVWNPQAEDLWGLRREEAEGRHFLNLDIGLPVDALKPAVRAALAGTDTSIRQRVDAINRRGKPIECLVTITPLLSPGNDGERTIRGAIIVMDEQPDASRDGNGSGPMAMQGDAALDVAGS